MTPDQNELAAELKHLMRVAQKAPETLDIPVLMTFWRMQQAQPAGERPIFFRDRLLPEYLDRLPATKRGQAMRALFDWEDEDGRLRSLDARYWLAQQRLGYKVADFGRREEPRLLRECAREFLRLDQIDRTERDQRHGQRWVETAEVYDRLDLARFLKELPGAQRVDILTTFIPQLTRFRAPLVEALRNGTLVRILLLDPGSAATPLRSAALGVDVESEVRAGIALLHELAGEAGEEGARRLGLRVYDALPSVSVYRIDERALVSFYLHTERSAYAPQLEVRGRDTLLGRAAFEELEVLWELGREV